MSLGKDLASIRKSQNLTLEDIQNAVKIPLNTLKSIENDSIFTDPTKNKTYVRSFVRSYAKVLKINDEEIVQALDEVETSSYAGGLIRESGTDEPESDINIDSENTFTETDDKSEGNPSQKLPETKKKVNDLPPEVETINWADMGRKFTTATKSSKVWVFIVFFVIIVLLSGVGYYFWNDIRLFVQDLPFISQEATSQTNQNAIPPALVDSSLITQNTENEVESAAENQNRGNTRTEPIVLGDTLTVAVYAAYGQLEPIRITSDLNWRTNPFWMEEGESYYFDFRDTLLVRGQYSRLLLLFNGHVIENPRQNYFNPAFNSIMITRPVLNQSRYLAPPPEEFPLAIGAPDSSVYRISF